MKKFTFILIICSIFFSAKAQHLDAYKIYNSKGYEISYTEMLSNLLTSDVILFGELHNDPIAHWLQLELTISIFEDRGIDLAIGAEMFERDNQLIIDEYFRGLISQGRFETEARLWSNYKTDYKPIVEFAKENSLQLIATNIPRRYAAMVSSGGYESLDKLSEQAKGYIAPLPIPYNPELPGYKAMLDMMTMPGRHGSNPENFPKAQAIKDATMAWNISQNIKPNTILLHLHGTYHSNNYEGISWYLNKYLPTKKVMTIATVLQNDITKLDENNINLAHFIIVVPTRMTRTY